MKFTTKDLVYASIIAALYTSLVMTFSFTSFGMIQFRVAEALTILPIFFPSAIPGIFIGCLISNILGGAILLDIIFGSLASLIAAVLTHKFRDNLYFAFASPIIINAIVVGLLLKYAYGISQPIIVLVSSVLIGQLVSVGIIGGVLYKSIQLMKSRFIKS